MGEGRESKDGGDEDGSNSCKRDWEEVELVGEEGGWREVRLEREEEKREKKGRREEDKDEDEEGQGKKEKMSRRGAEGQPGVRNM